MILWEDDRNSRSGHNKNVDTVSTKFLKDFEVCRPIFLKNAIFWLIEIKQIDMCRYQQKSQRTERNNCNVSDSPVDGFFSKQCFFYFLAFMCHNSVYFWATWTVLISKSENIPDLENVNN